MTIHNGVDIKEDLDEAGQDFYEQYGCLPPPDGWMTVPQLLERLGLHSMQQLLRRIDSLRFAKKIPFISPDTDKNGHAYGKRREEDFTTIYSDEEVRLITNAH